MSSFDDFLAVEIGQDGHIGQVFLSKPISPTNSPILPNTAIDKGICPICPIRPLGADPYPTEERLAIQQEDSYISDLAAIDAVPGFDGLPDLTPAQHGAILKRLMGGPKS